MDFCNRYQNTPNTINSSALILDRDGKKMLTKQKADSHLVKKSKEGLIYVISDETIDRGNDQMIIKGVDLVNYDKNNIVLFNHLSKDTLPIGNGIVKRKGKELLGETIFHKQTQLSRDIAALCEAEVMKMTSIGFMPIKFEDIKNEDQEAEQYGDWTYTPTIRKYLQWELLEYSIVNIPMNPNAGLQHSLSNDITDIINEGVERGLIESDSEFIKRLDNNGIKLIEPTEESVMDKKDVKQSEAEAINESIALDITESLSKHLVDVPETKAEEIRNAIIFDMDKIITNAFSDNEGIAKSKTEIIEKAGRKISKANMTALKEVEAALKGAADKVNTVIGSAENTDEETSEDQKDLNQDVMDLKTKFEVMLSQFEKLAPKETKEDQGQESEKELDLDEVYNEFMNKK